MEFPKVLRPLLFSIYPLLFPIFISDLPLFIKACCGPFADDTAVALISESYRSHNRRVSTLLEWAEFNYMSLRPHKAKSLFITTRQKRQNLNLKCLSISFGNQTVNELNNHKVLSVTIDCNLSWSSHVTALCKSTSNKVYQVSKIKHFWTSMPENIFSCPYSIHHRLRIDTVGLGKCKYS